MHFAIDPLKPREEIPVTVLKSLLSQLGAY
jgi:hypothetical protein